MNKRINQLTNQHNSNESAEIQAQFLNPWAVVKDWYQTDLGQELFNLEKQCISKQIEHFFGYNLIQLGCFDIKNESLISLSKISNHFVFESLPATARLSEQADINVRFEALPVKSNSIDLLVLPHTLEFEKYPHQILREVERVLMAEGKVILFVFNPYSLWGLWHKYWQIKIKSQAATQAPLPSYGNLISQRRLKDWLQLLGFDIDYVQGYFSRPPLKNASLLNKLSFIEKISGASSLIPVGAYMVIASKRVSTLTPIRQPWVFSKPISTSKAQQPSSGFKGHKVKKQIKGN